MSAPLPFLNLNSQDLSESPDDPESRVPTQICGDNCLIRQFEFEKIEPKYELRKPVQYSDDFLQASQKELYGPRKLDPSNIRIARLLSGTSNSILQCELFTIAIDGIRYRPFGHELSKRYDALSYSWDGEVSRTATIRVWQEGMKASGKTEFPVSQNLANALRYLRQPDHHRFLWCDAICINQSNNREKEQQVRHMLRIFEQAERVIGWIGEPTKSTGRVFQTLKSKDLSSLHPFFHTKGHRSKAERLKFELREHSNRAWFFRTWVRQEVFAADNLQIMCGTETLDYKSFADRMKELLRDTEPHDPKISEFIGPQTFMTLRDDFRHSWRTRVISTAKQPPVGVHESKLRKPYTIHWLDILNKGTSFKVTDDRDRIYAALGMIQSETARPYVEARPDHVWYKEYPIDYNKTVSQVYQDLAIYLINNDMTLDILRVYEDRRNHASDLPSWAIDWRVQKARYFPTQILDHQQTKQAVGEAPEQHPRIYDCLNLKGQMIAKLSSIHDDYLPNPCKNSHGGDYCEKCKFHKPFQELHSELHECFIRGTIKSPKNQQLDILIPRNSMIDDKVVVLRGGRGLFLLRGPMSNTERDYQFLGPAGAVSELAWTDPLLKSFLSPSTDDDELFILV